MSEFIISVDSAAVAKAVNESLAATYGRFAGTARGTGDGATSFLTNYLVRALPIHREDVVISLGVPSSTPDEENESLLGSSTLVILDLRLSLEVEAMWICSGFAPGPFELFAAIGEALGQPRTTLALDLRIELSFGWTSPKLATPTSATLLELLSKEVGSNGEAKLGFVDSWANLALRAFLDKYDHWGELIQKPSTPPELVAMVGDAFFGFSVAITNPKGLTDNLSKKADLIGVIETLTNSLSDNAYSLRMDTNQTVLKGIAVEEAGSLEKLEPSVLSELLDGLTAALGETIGTLGLTKGIESLIPSLKRFENDVVEAIRGPHPSQVGQATDPLRSRVIERLASYFRSFAPDLPDVEARARAEATTSGTLLDEARLCLWTLVAGRLPRWVTIVAASQSESNTPSWARHLQFWVDTHELWAFSALSNGAASWGGAAEPAAGPTSPVELHPYGPLGANGDLGAEIRLLMSNRHLSEEVRSRLLVALISKAARCARWRWLLLRPGLQFNGDAVYKYVNQQFESDGDAIRLARTPGFSGRIWIVGIRGALDWSDSSFRIGIRIAASITGEEADLPSPYNTSAEVIYSFMTISLRIRLGDVGGSGVRGFQRSPKLMMTDLKTYWTDELNSGVGIICGWEGCTDPHEYMNEEARKRVQPFLDSGVADGFLPGQDAVSDLLDEFSELLGLHPCASRFAKYTDESYWVLDGYASVHPAKDVTNPSSDIKSAFSSTGAFDLPLFCSSPVPPVAAVPTLSEVFMGQLAMNPGMAYRAEWLATQYPEITLPNSVTNLAAAARVALVYTDVGPVGGAEEPEPPGLRPVGPVQPAEVADDVALWAASGGGTASQLKTWAGSQATEAGPTDYGLMVVPASSGGFHVAILRPLAAIDSDTVRSAAEMARFIDVEGAPPLDPMAVREAWRTGQPIPAAWLRYVPSSPLFALPGYLAIPLSQVFGAPFHVGYRGIGNTCPLTLVAPESTGAILLMPVEFIEATTARDSRAKAVRFSYRRQSDLSMSAAPFGFKIYTNYVAFSETKPPFGVERVLADRVVVVPEVVTLESEDGFPGTVYAGAFDLSLRRIVVHPSSYKFEGNRQSGLLPAGVGRRVCVVVITGEFGDSLTITILADSDATLGGEEIQHRYRWVMTQRLDGEPYATGVYLETGWNTSSSGVLLASGATEAGLVPFVRISGEWPSDADALDTVGLTGYHSAGREVDVIAARYSSVTAGPTSAPTMARRSGLWSSYLRDNKVVNVQMSMAISGQMFFLDQPGQAKATDAWEAAGYRPITRIRRLGSYGVESDSRVMVHSFGRIEGTLPPGVPIGAAGERPETSAARIQRELSKLEWTRKPTRLPPIAARRARRLATNVTTAPGWTPLRVGGGTFDSTRLDRVERDEADEAAQMAAYFRDNPHGNPTFRSGLPHASKSSTE